MSALVMEKDKNIKGDGKRMSYSKEDHTPKKLKKLRIENGYSVYSLAKELGVHASTVSYWENGVKFPKPEAMMKLEDIFGLGYRELFKDLTEEEIELLEEEFGKNNKKDK